MPFRGLVPATLLFVLLAAPAVSAQEADPAASDELTPEEREELERALAPDPVATATPQPVGLQGTLQSMNPNISFILDVAAAAFRGGEPLQQGAHDPNRNGFTLQQLELSVNSAVDPFFAYNSNLVFSQFGVEIEEAYGTTTALPFNLQARAGQFLTRFGRANATHPHSWEFADQPLILGKFMGGEGNRGLGGELSWLAPTPWYAELTGSLTDATGGATARSFFGAQNFSVRSPLDLQATTQLTNFFPLSRDWSLNWGLSAASGPNPTGRANRTDLFGTDLYLKYRPLADGSFTIVSLTTEALLRRRQVPDGLRTDYGGYSSLFWRFGQQWGTGLRYELGSGAPGDDLDPDWTGDRQRLSANLTYWPTEFSRMRLQGSYDRPAWRPEPIYAAFLTMEFVTGAHGAHKF